MTITPTFVSKSLILSASGYEEMFCVWIALLVASIGAILHTGLRLPYLAFFGCDSSLRPKEAPPGMLMAMGLTAALCIMIGAFPAALYALLPNDVSYEPYTFSHIIVQLQLIAFVTLAFTRAVKIGFLPKLERVTILEFDWTYRRLLPAVIRGFRRMIGTLWGNASYNIDRRLNHFLTAIYSLHGPHGPFARTWPTGAMVMVVALLLGMTLVLTYL